MKPVAPPRISAKRPRTKQISLIPLVVPRLGKGWSIVRLRDQVDGRDSALIVFPLAGSDQRRSFIVPVSALRNPRALTDELADQGAQLPKDPQTWVSLIGNLATKLPETSSIHRKRTGWYGPAVVLPNRIFNPPEEEIVLDPRIGALSSCSGKGVGNRATWVSEVAEPAAQSSYLAFAIMHGLAAPLARFAGFSDGVIFNFVGGCPTDVRVALLAGASVHGTLAHRPDGTEKGLVELAAAHSDYALVIDRLEHLLPSHEPSDHWKQASNLLTGGSSTVRPTDTWGQRYQTEWSSWVLSSSPQPLAPLVSGRRGSQPAFDRVRLIDVPVPGPEQGTIWDRLEDQSEENKQAADIETAARMNHGWLTSSWLELLTERYAMLSERVPAEVTLATDVLCQAHGDTYRQIATRFALIRVAGDWAINEKLLPWPPEVPSQVAERLFAAAVTAVAPMASDPVTDGLDSLRKAVDDPNLSRFVAREAPPAYPAGYSGPFRFKLRDNEGEWLCLDLRALTEIVGVDRVSVVNEHLRKGHLIARDKGGALPQVWITIGEKSSRPRLLKLHLGKLMSHLG